VVSVAKSATTPPDHHSKRDLIIIIIIIIIIKDKIRVKLSREITASGALYNKVLKTDKTTNRNSD